MGAPVAASELGDEPMALVAQPRAPFERRCPVQPGLDVGGCAEVGCRYHASRRRRPVGRSEERQLRRHVRAQRLERARLNPLGLARVRPTKLTCVLILGWSQGVAELVLDRGGVIAQDGVRGDVEPARLHRLGLFAMRAYVTATPSKPRGGRGEDASAASSTPSRLAARAHCRVSGPVGLGGGHGPDMVTSRADTTSLTKWR
jgi:hypothetical protein